MVIIGLDPGSLRTGYAVISTRGSSLQWMEGGTWRTPRGEVLARRLRVLHLALDELLGRTRPDALAMEACFMGRHARAALVLGHARGALITAALARDVSLFEYAPRLVKLAATGTGGASKAQVQTMVRRLVAGTPEDLGEDTADALAVAICHAHRDHAARCRAAVGEVQP